MPMATGREMWEGNKTGKTRSLVFRIEHKTTRQGDMSRRNKAERNETKQEMPKSNSKAQIHKCSMLKCTIGKCSNAQMPNAQMHNAQMLRCSNAQMHKCSNAQMLRCSKCSNAQMLTMLKRLKCSNTMNQNVPGTYHRNPEVHQPVEAHFCCGESTPRRRQ